MVHELVHERVGIAVRSIADCARQLSPPRCIAKKRSPPWGLLSRPGTAPHSLATESSCQAAGKRRAFPFPPIQQSTKCRGAAAPVGRVRRGTRIT